MQNLFELDFNVTQRPGQQVINPDPMCPRVRFTHSCIQLYQNIVHADVIRDFNEGFLMQNK